MRRERMGIITVPPGEDGVLGFDRGSVGTWAQFVEITRACTGKRVTRVLMVEYAAMIWLGGSTETSLHTSPNSGGSSPEGGVAVALRVTRRRLVILNSGLFR